MDGWVDGLMGVWVGRLMDGRKDEGMDGRIKGRKHEWMDRGGWMDDGWVGG